MVNAGVALINITFMVNLTTVYGLVELKLEKNGQTMFT